MNKQNGKMEVLVGLVITLFIGVGLAFFMPWNRIHWGKIEWTPAETVVVNGEAKTRQKNQIASFSAGVDAVNDSKEAAVKEVNSKVEALINSVKDFGIKAEDIKTQSLSIYQNEESYWDDGVQRSRKGQWRASNSVEIILRDVDRATKLADVLASTGANNVYGPNFQFDDTTGMETALFDDAMKNAREKAEAVAKSSGRSLGKVLNVSEGYGGVNYMPYYAKADMGGGGAPIEPGTGTVSKSITVTFELK